MDDRPYSPSTISTFSMTSTLEHRVFRDDGGRQYQATNDEYSLPADEAELDRLNIQHKVFKVMQGDKNYLAPMEHVLNASEGGKEKRLLDVGTGTGLWAIEMAQEFPHVQVLGIDLSPVQYQHEVPDNCQFAREDAAKGLPYPDGYFDIVHLRALTAGIRDWPAMVSEGLRVTAPGGLVVFVDSAGAFQLAPSMAEAKPSSFPGFTRFAALFVEALGIRGMDVECCSVTIPKLLDADERAGPVSSVHVDLPMTPWSEDPIWRRAGKVMVPDTKEIPSALRLLIQDACELSAAEYEKVTEDVLRDLFEKNAPGVVQTAHVWAHKL